MAGEQANELIRLSEMPSTALIAVDRLAELLNRDHESIRKAIKRGELPEPIPICSKRYWVVGYLLDFFHQRSETIEAQPSEDREHSAAIPKSVSRTTRSRDYQSPIRKV